MSRETKKILGHGSDYYPGTIELDVRYAGDVALGLVLGLAMASERDTGVDATDPYVFVGFAEVDEPFTRYGGEPEVAGPWLVMYGARRPRFRDELPDGAHPLLAAQSVREITPIVARWLDEKDPDSMRPSNDGTVRPGAFHAVMSYRVGNKHGYGARLAIRRAWAVYGK